MIVFLKESQVRKSRYKDFNVVAISLEVDLEDLPNERVSLAQTLVPPNYIVGEFMNHNNFDRYCKDYFKYLLQDELRQNMSLILFDVTHNKIDYAFVCSDAEWELEYMRALQAFIVKLYGLKSLTNKEYKIIEKHKDKRTIEALSSVQPEIAEMIMEDVRGNISTDGKKKKKKDKDKKKKKDKKKNKHKDLGVDDINLKGLASIYGYSSAVNNKNDEPDEDEYSEEAEPEIPMFVKVK